MTHCETMWQPRQSRGSPPLSSLFLLLSLSFLTAVASTDALVVSARRGLNRQLLGVSKVASATGVSQSQCQLVCHQHNCKSFNYHADSGSCEALSATACQSNSYHVVSSTGWVWFDVVAELVAESNQTLWHGEACVRDGRCRDSCLRQLNQNCRHSQQCEHLVSGSTECGGWKCQCKSDHWQFNETLCLPRDEQLFTDGEYWVWKKIVNNLCSTEFSVQASGGVTIVLAESYTHYSNRYVFTLSQHDIKATRVEEGVNANQYASKSKNMLSGDRFRRLGMSWCSGKMRFWEAGQSYIISWNDGRAFSPKYLAIYSTSGTEGRWRFPERLVDPWFGDDWSATRVYSIPPETWILRRRTEQDFWVEFECRIKRDCNWMAREQNTWHNANIWTVVIGGWDNTHSAIHRHTTNGAWQYFSHTSTPAILNATEFRRFRIHFTPAKISVYRADEPDPFMTHNIGSHFMINFDGPHMCCNTENIEYRLVQYDDGWSHEGGFRWGENLVD